MQISDAIRHRSSIRAYKDQPVEKSVVDDILTTANHCPSGANIQPWHVAVVTGQTKANISNDIMKARKAGTTENPDYQYYPIEWFEPFKTRRVECGMALYDALEIQRDDKVRRMEQWFRNYQFFDAPVGLFFFLHEKLELGSWVDMGMYIQTVMLAALDHDLGTCPQASLIEYPDIVRQHLNLSSKYRLVCGMSMGYPDLNHPVNNYRVKRVSAREFTKWYD